MMTKREFTKEHRRNISLATVGKKRKPFTEEHKRNMSIAAKGKPKSEEHKRNISIGQTGRKHSAETIRKRSIANTGLKRTEEQKQRMSQIKTESLIKSGYKTSKEMRRKMSISALNRKKPMKKILERKVREVGTIVTPNGKFKTLLEAGIYYNVTKQTISNRIKSKYLPGYYRQIKETEDE